MYRIAYRVLGSAAAADDACQEAFLHLRRGAGRFQPPADGDASRAAHAWLMKVAANAAAMWARTERRRARREQRRREGAIAVAAGAVDDRPVEELRLALADLPDSQRLPIVLHHLGGQDYEAIASSLGISPGAARVRAHRGIENLRNRLARAGVLVAATGLLSQIGAGEAASPAGAAARWTAILTSTSTPAATSAAIFGGISVMTKLAIIGTTLTAAALVCASAMPAWAEERGEEKPKAHTETTAKPAEGTVKQEGKDALAEGTKGVSTGVIVSLEKGKLVLRTADGNLLFMPHWRGGNPKDGGGFDKAVLEKLGTFKAGDSVKIEWTWSERRRIETIAKAEK